MRKNKPLRIALVFGILCAVSVMLYMHSLEAQIIAAQAQSGQSSGEVCEVYVATRDVMPGERLTEENCEKKLFSQSLVPDGALESLSDFEYEGLSVPLFKGEVATERHFETLLREKLSVPRGYVAVSVPAQDVAAVGANIQSGAYVDVYATNAQTTKKILDHVLVLDTSIQKNELDEGSKNSSKSLTWITLAVKPDVVEDLISISHKSELYFVVGSVEAESKTEEEHINESTHITLS